MKTFSYSLALRLKRTCSEHNFLKNLDFLKNALVTHGYKCNYIMTSFDRVVNIDCTLALQFFFLKRCVLPLMFDPRLPNISNIQSY